MAATLWRTTTSILRRSLPVASVRYASGPPSKPVDVHKGKVPVKNKMSNNPLPIGEDGGEQPRKKIEQTWSASDDIAMPDSLGHSVGLERMELLAREAGDDDPFEMKVIKRAKGTFEEPTIITSPNTKRMVGCICEEDALTINWMYVHKGEPKRCECGYWFKLTDAPVKNYM